jgi:chitinase
LPNTAMMKKRRGRFTVPLATAVLAGVTQAALPGLSPMHSAPSAIAAVPVIAYLPGYRIAALDPAVCSSLTDLIFFSIEPTVTGGLDLSHLKPEQLTALRDWKQRYHLRLLIALGGWGRSAGFGPMATNVGARGRFIQALTQFCAENQFDGADFDWEHPQDAAEEAAYARLLAETKQAFQPHGRLVSVTMAAWQKLPKDGLEAADRVQVMAYDHDGRHATFDGARADVDSVATQGAARSKICLGVPFYGRNVTKPDESLTYAEIVSKYHPAPDVDEVDGIYFNGIRTMQQKARYVTENHLGGVMIWEVGQDTRDDTSLLRAVRGAIPR